MKKLIYVLSANKRVKIKIQKRMYQGQDGFHWTAEPQWKTQDGSWVTYNHHLITGWDALIQPELTLEDSSVLGNVMEFVMLRIAKLIPEYILSAYMDLEQQVKNMYELNEELKRNLQQTESEEDDGSTNAVEQPETGE